MSPLARRRRRRRRRRHQRASPPEHLLAQRSTVTYGTKSRRGVLPVILGRGGLCSGWASSTTRHPLAVALPRKRMSASANHSPPQEDRDGIEEVLDTDACQIQWDELHVEREIGRGTGTTVYSGVWRDHAVAVKVLNEGASRQTRDIMRKEVAFVTQRLGRHPHILTYYRRADPPQAQGVAPKTASGLLAHAAGGQCAVVYAPAPPGASGSQAEQRVGGPVADAGQAERLWRESRQGAQRRTDDHHDRHLPVDGAGGDLRLVVRLQGGCLQFWRFVQ
eukprot:ctg_94.g57